MYSLLLMTAMTTGGDAPAFGGRSAGCHGCNGAVVSYGCNGSCTGGSCHGCNGGMSCHGGRGGLFGRFHRGSSCHGCYGSSCHGGGGACNGCWGASCHGCNGGAAYYPQGCYGGGCYGGGCYGGGYYGGAQVAPVIMEPAPAPAAPAQPTPVPPPVGEKKASASITIELPANATLYVDGQPTVAAGATRQFHTPELPVGQAYYYDMKAEVEVGGRKVVEEMKVLVAGGQSVTRTFGQLLAAAGGADRQVASK